MKKFGKHSDSLLSLKRSFFEENEMHLKKQSKISELYIKQPKRDSCKNCNSKLTHEADFIKLNIPYEICYRCNHLNGLHDDSSEFCKAVYEEDTGEEEYGKNYSSSNDKEYAFRTSSIYIPKAEFLYSSLLKNGINPNNLSYIDIGAGSGYFVNALNKIGIENIRGYEVSKSQVDLGNANIGIDLLTSHGLEETNDIINNSKDNVINYC